MGLTHSNFSTIDPVKGHVGGAELFRLISELISLRERVTQAELRVAQYGSLENSSPVIPGSLQCLWSEIALLRQDVEQAERDQASRQVQLTSATEIAQARISKLSRLTV